MDDDPSPRPPSARRDLAAAMLLIALGGAVAWVGAGYRIGTLGRMGPGFFPLALGLILAGLGVVLLVAPSLGEGGEDEPADGAPADPRGWGLVVAGMAAFLLLTRHGGMVPATFALVLLSALGDRRNGLRTAVALALAMTLVGVVLFRFLLGVQIPLFVWGR